MHTKLLVPLLLVAIVAVTAGWYVSGRAADPRSGLARALAALPAQTHTASFTEWREIRESLGFETLDADIDRSTVSARAFERGLSSRSLLSSSDRELVAAFGWSSVDFEWEMYGQSDDGAVAVLGLGELTAATVERSLLARGYVQDGSGFTASQESESQGLPAALSNVRLVDDMMVLSDSAGYADLTVATIGSPDTSLAADRDVAAAAAPFVAMESVVIRDRAKGCAVASFAEAIPDDRARANGLLRARGSLQAYRATARGVDQTSTGQRFALSVTFGSAATASRQGELRAGLAEGDVIGQSGTYDERFTATRLSTDGPSATLTFDVRESAGSILTDLDDGRLLPAACPAA